MNYRLLVEKEKVLFTEIVRHIFLTLTFAFVGLGFCRRKSVEVQSLSRPLHCETMGMFLIVLLLRHGFSMILAGIRTTLGLQTTLEWIVHYFKIIK